MKFLITFIFLVLPMSVSAGTYIKKDSGYDAATATFFDKEREIASFEVEIANAPELRQQGLMNREKLDKEKGMLFAFPDSHVRFFWMMETSIPLDIIYINAKKRIVSIVPNTVPYDLKLISSKFPAKYVVEINAGLSKALGIEEGQRMVIE